MGSGYCKQVVREGAENLGESVPLLREQQVRSSPGGRGQCGWSRAEQVKGKVVPGKWSLMRSDWRQGPGPRELLKLAGRNLGFYPKYARRSLQGLNM